VCVEALYTDCRARENRERERRRKRKHSDRSMVRAIHGGKINSYTAEGSLSK
jgi:hypothetical protein